MKDWKSQAHVKWECKYHVVILPKYRKKMLYGKVRRRIGEKRGSAADISLLIFSMVCL